MKRFLKVFFSWLLIFTVIIGGGIYILSEKLLPEGSIEAGKENKKELTFLALGLDAQDVASAQNDRTDTIMLFRYTPETGKMSVLSIPRDTRVMIPGKGMDKLNHAHAYGGPELTIKAVNNLLDMNIEHYVRIDYNLVKEVVDTLGGVEVDVPMDMRYSDPYANPPLKIDIKKGVQVLDGDESMQFLRFRSGYGDQDLGRIRAQQNFIESAIEEALKPSNITKAPSMIRSGVNNIDTNIPVTTMLSYATELNNIKTENLYMATMPGEPSMIGGVSYFIHEEEGTQRLMELMFHNRELINRNLLDLEEIEEDEEEF